MATCSTAVDSEEERSLAFHPYLNGHHDAEHDMRRAIERRTIEAVAVARGRLDEVGDREALGAERERVRSTVQASLGGPIEVGFVPTQFVKRISDSRMTIDALVYQPRPEIHVPATLYTPTNLDGPAGAVFIACGHTDEAKADADYQLLARSLCSSGLVVLIADPIGQGERHSYPEGSDPHVPWGTREHTYAGIQSWWHGFSPARWFVEDAMAGISVLTQLPDVDPTRIGVTGHSGGGALVTLLAAVDDRLAAFAPGTFVSSHDVAVLSGQPQDAEQITLAGLANGVDSTQLLLCAAPRPVLVLAAKYDFFPLEGTHRSIRDCNAVLTRTGLPSIELAVADDGHAYSASLRESATSFFRRVLEGSSDHPDPREQSDDLLSATDLECFTDGVREAHPDEAFIFERTVAHSSRYATARDRIALDAARNWLLDAVTRGGDPSDERFERWFPAEKLAGGCLRRGFWQSDRGVHTSAAHWEPSGPTEVLRIIIGPTTEQLTTRSLSAITDSATLILDVRGTGAVQSAGRKSPSAEPIIGSEYKMMCDLLRLDDSLEAARVRDVLYAVLGAFDGVIPDRRFSRVEIVGTGERTFTASIAAALCGLPLSIDEAEAPSVDAEASERAWDAGAGRWKWLIPGFVPAVGDDLLQRLNDPVVRGEHRDLALLGVVRNALARPALSRVGDGNCR